MRAIRGCIRDQEVRTFGYPAVLPGPRRATPRNAATPRLAIQGAAGVGPARKTMMVLSSYIDGLASRLYGQADGSSAEFYLAVWHVLGEDFSAAARGGTLAQAGSDGDAAQGGGVPRT